MLQAPKIYNILADQNFFQQLTKGIIDRFTATCNLKDVIILLPTKHACDSLRQIFLQNGTQVPKIYPINDIGNLAKPFLESSLASREAAQPGISEVFIRSPFLPAPLGAFIRDDELGLPLDRMALVAKISQIILNLKLINFNNLIAVAELAEYFANFLHNANLYQIDLNQAIQIIDEDLTLHQQELLSLLKAFIRIWQTDPSVTKAEYNNNLLESFANNLANQTLVIAGISSNIPSILNLMLKQNAHIVFYGLDQHLNNLDWTHVNLTHPQYNFKQILSKLEVNRNKVLNWYKENNFGSVFLSEAMKPAGSCNNWYQLSALDSSNLSYLSCQDQHTEAKAIIEYIQKAPHQTIMIITSDDALMVKIMLHLSKAKIDANIIRDHPLIQSETAIWLELCLNFINEDFSLLSGLALLKHPFAAIDPETIAELELIVRNKNFRSNNIFDAHPIASSSVSCVGSLSLNTTSSSLVSCAESAEQTEDLIMSLTETLNQLHLAVQTFKQLFLYPQVSFKNLLETHLSFAANIAPDSIWQNTSGEELQLYLKQVDQHAEFLGDLSPQDYQPLFTHLLKSAYYRKDQQASSSITLAKPIDARLHTAELVILAGLNEGIWPAKPTIDPCFNNNLLNKIGLPNLEQFIGEEAYDFQCFASGKKVLLTRSEKIDGVITIPSRWLLRILTLAKNINILILNNNTIITPPASSLASREEARPGISEVFSSQDPKVSNSVLAQNDALSANPAPTPAIQYRPTQLSVTQVEKLVFNPYHIYVDLILKLKKLPNLIKKLSALDFGIFVHKAIEIYEHSSNHTYDGFLEAGTQALNGLNLNYPQLKLIYWPRFTRIAEWFVTNEEPVNKVYLENSGSLKITDNFTLTARADRIEVIPANSINIIDYKTGRLSSAKSIYDGQSLQLLLEGLIGLNGGFYCQKTPAKLNKLTYIQLSGGEDPVEILEIDVNERSIIEQTQQYLNDLVMEYQDPQTPYYYTKKKTLGYCEYAHLARMFGK